MHRTRIIFHAIIETVIGDSRKPANLACQGRTIHTCLVKDLP
jgi:hypothetical protein